MVEVALTKLSGTDRRAGRQTSTSKYRDAMQIQELGTGAELCQAQIKLVLAKVGTSLHFPEHFRLSSI